MKNKPRKLQVWMIFVIFLLCACDGSSQDALIQTAIYRTEVANTPLAENKSTPSQAPLLTLTPIATSTSTKIPTSTITPFPSDTPGPTLTPSRTITATNTITPTRLPKVGTEIKCGDQFTIKLYFVPIMTKSASYNKAVGKFLILRLHIKNATSKSWEELPYESFKMFGELNGSILTSSVDEWNTIMTNARWDTKNLTDPLPPQVIFDTFIVFDVNPDATKWVLEFSPRESIFDDPVCSIQIPLPGIDYK